MGAPLRGCNSIDVLIPCAFDESFVVCNERGVTPLCGLFAFEGVVGGANRILRRLPSGGP